MKRLYCAMIAVSLLSCSGASQSTSDSATAELPQSSSESLTEELPQPNSVSPTLQLPQVTAQPISGVVLVRYHPFPETIIVRNSLFQSKSPGPTRQFLISESGTASAVAVGDKLAVTYNMSDIVIQGNDGSSEKGNAVVLRYLLDASGRVVDVSTKGFLAEEVTAAGEQGMQQLAQLSSVFELPQEGFHAGQIISRSKALTIENEPFSYNEIWEVLGETQYRGRRAIVLRTESQRTESVLSAHTKGFQFVDVGTGQISYGKESGDGYITARGQMVPVYVQIEYDLELR
jgi:hypothetical protein